MDVSAKDIIAILTTVKQQGFRRFRMEHQGLVLEVDSEGGAASMPRAAAMSAGPQPPAVSPDPPAATSHPAVAAQPAPSPGAIAVTAPMTGTFYRSPSPGAPPFVEVGRAVAAGDIVCIIEVMKLFNSIPAGVAGRIVRIDVTNEGAVIAGQPVIWIVPG